MTKITHFDEHHEKMRAYSKKTRRFQRFKVEQSRFYAIIDAQNRQCPICGAEYDENPLTWAVCRDSKGVVLGVVCAKCARGLLNFNHDGYLLAKARAFIDSAPELTYPYIVWDDSMGLPDEIEIDSRDTTD